VRILASAVSNFYGEQREMVPSGLENRDTLKEVTPFDSTVLRHFANEAGAHLDKTPHIFTDSSAEWSATVSKTVTA
jgi:hypothetical protein